MFSEQASQFFLGKSNLFTPVDQPEARHPQRVLPENRRQGSRSGESLWSKLVFTGKATPPKEYANSAEVKKAVADPKAIGYIDKSAVDDTVKVILTLP
jgi:hypothetical protein